MYGKIWSMPYKYDTPENIEKARASRRKHYRENKEQYYRRNDEKEQHLRHFVAAVKSYPCEDCGLTYPPYVMDFDHLPGFIKDGNISKMYNKGSWGKIIIEIMKCDLVCANCHRERTHNRKEDNG